MNRRAFSLAEMLVVVAVVAILAGLLLPVLTRAKARSAETVCLSNMHQIYLAAGLYEADHNEPPPNNIVLPPWRPYLDATKLLCPIGSPDRKVAGDYSVLVDNAPGHVHESRSDCIKVRGGAIPVIFDDNHARTLEASRVGYRVELFVRQDGSAGTRPGSFDLDFDNHPERYPCPYADAEDNY